ncbi:MAG: transcriptional repressor LexA [Chloroflexi bacterium]|nr:MAG: transcriptional repressor LexA [Chloroflexota bacterium]
MTDFDKLSERQRNILRFIRSHIDAHGFPPSIRQIGEATGIDSTSVVNYNLNKLVKAGYLARSERVSRGLRLVRDLPGESKKRVRALKEALRVPVLGQIVAGEPVPTPGDVFSGEDDVLDIPAQILGKADPDEVYALKVKGDSMVDAMIQDGDIVIFRHQETAKNGDMVAVWLDERGETTLKHFYNEGNRIRLQPAHPTMEPIYVDPAHCHIQGKVVSVIRHVG